jgi:DNA-binding CsgD family transcriptional regulator
MNATATLTKRESEIAELIAWGATKKDVANRLFISERTVENTARSIYEKTGVTKSNELSAWWFCTRFHISFDLSPMKRALTAIILLVILIPREFNSEHEIIRTFRSRKTEIRANRKGSDEYVFDFDMDF